MFFLRFFAGLIFAGILFAACGQGDQTKQPETPTPPPIQVADGKALYETNCVVCHGISGKGDGPAAATLNPKSADFTSRIIRDKCRFKKAAIETAIREGGARTGAPKGSVMPPWKSLTQEEVNVLVKYVCESFAGEK